MKRKRLKRLANLLRRDARNKKGVKFNLEFWVAPANSDDKAFPMIPLEEIPVDCGTSACAMGLAVISKEFEKEGLHAAYSPRFGVSAGYPNAGYTMEPRLFKDGYDYTGFEAAMQLFNITEAQSFWLFGPQFYPEEKRKGAKAERAVARRIDYVVKHGKLPHGMKSMDDLPQH